MPTKISPAGVKKKRATKTRQKPSALISDIDARVQEALTKASREAKRRATLDKVPLVATRRKTWSVPK